MAATRPAAAPRGRAAAPVTRVRARAYSVPTDAPESDGTLEWSATGLLVVRVEAAGEHGTGYAYTHPAAADIVRSPLARVVEGEDAFAIPRLWQAQQRAVRNLGRPGVAASAISAVDTALWDLKGRLLGRPVVDLLGRARDAIPAYGSGGFTSYALPRLAEQLGGWAAAGLARVKMKVGRDPAADLERVGAARAAIGDDVGLMVDANGAYDAARAVAVARQFEALGVSWFEEPVSSDDLAGLRHVREHVPAGMAVAAGEYGYEPGYFLRMANAGAVDVLQADATRCLGLSGFVAVGALCEAVHVPLSSHTAPTLHAHACCVVPAAIHAEYFHDHARIESMLFDGALRPAAGDLRPDPGRPGLGIEFKDADAERYAA